MDRATLRRVRSLYTSTPLRVRMHIAMRLALCPFERLAGFVPESGLIVDLGCGHGLFAHALAIDAPSRRIVGVEPSPHKLAVASSVPCKGQRIHFVQGDAPANPVGATCRAILLIDVLYLLSRAQQEGVLRDCYDRLCPGGVLLIKTMDDRPRWKAALNRLEEWLAVRVLRITLCEEGAFAFRPLSEWAALCREIGFVPQTVRLEGYYHPHGVVVGVRP